MSCESGVHVHACSALINGVCKNGFPFRRACIQTHVVSPSGHEQWPMANLLPPCLDEDFPVTVEGDA
jgi:hypothetical protein